MSSGFACHTYTFADYNLQGVQDQASQPKTKKHENKLQGGISVWKLQCSHVQKRTPASTKLLPFILILRHQKRNTFTTMAVQSINQTCHANQKNGKNDKNLYCVMDSLGPAEHGTKTWTTWITCPENSCQQHLSLKTTLLASAEDILLHRQNYSLKVVILRLHFMLKRRFNNATTNFRACFDSIFAAASLTLHLQGKCKHEGPSWWESGRISVWKLQRSHVQKKTPLHQQNYSLSLSSCDLYLHSIYVKVYNSLGSTANPVK